MSAGNKPLRLDTALPRMSLEAQQRCTGSLEQGCYCGSETAKLVRRTTNGSVTVWLQCTGCGRGVGGAMARAQHYGFQDYPEWDRALVERKHAEWDAEATAYREQAAERARLAAEARAQVLEERSNYRQWCRTSPDWHSLSDRVHRRDRDLCQGCLVAPSSVVHHLTYELGRLPPAWHLIAVCDGCHDRIHADKHGRDDDWCPA